MFTIKVVGRCGFEPQKTKSTDLQSVAFGRSAIFPRTKFTFLINQAKVMPRTGSRKLAIFWFLFGWCLEPASNQ